MTKKQYDYEKIKSIAERDGIVFKDKSNFVFRLHRRYFAVKNGEISFNHAKKETCFNFLEAKE
jgi:hypothetical protein